MTHSNGPVPASLREALALAQRHHQSAAGEAEALYRQILAADPNQIDALHLFGVLAGQRGRDDAAVELIGKVLALRPDIAAAHSNLRSP